MTTASTWFRRFSNDQLRASSSSSHPNCLPPNSYRNNGWSYSRRGPINFITNLYASSRRRFSLPVSGIPANSMSNKSGHGDNMINEECLSERGSTFNRNHSLPSEVALIKNKWLISFFFNLFLSFQRSSENPKLPRSNMSMNVPDSARRVTVVDQSDKTHFTGIKGKQKKTPRKLVSSILNFNFCKISQWALT